MAAPAAPFDPAVVKNNVKIANMLIDAGFDAKSPNIGGETPLHVAVAKPIFLDVAKRLVEREGVEVNARNHRGETPLHVACGGFFEGKDKVVWALLDMPGIDCHAKTHYGQTPLGIAVNCGNTDIGRVLSPFKGRRKQAK